MKTADLYVRVSTDEQADKGYSQRGQEEMLRKYCEINRISVRKVIYEDHSAKTFERPAWMKLLTDLRKTKGKVDLVLFTKWDRFSRNAGDAYQMISILRKLGAEPQAIEQPLDLTIPENKMMLAFYLAAPEVENDRRALNTMHGMRRAQKEGRYMGVAPVGYINRITESGRKFIAIHQSQARLLKQAFEEVATGIYTVEDVRKRAVRKGLKCAKTTFWRALENPLYFGKIEVKGYRDEKTMLVDGQHEALISEKLFYDIQDAIDGKRKRQRPNVKELTNAAFELRGFLECPKCGKILTASASKGRSARYGYYHCRSSCGVRYSAPALNEAFLQELQKFKPRKATVTLFRELVISEFSDQIKNQQKEKKQVLEEIQKQNDRLTKARELLLSFVLDGGEYKTIVEEARGLMRNIRNDQIGKEDSFLIERADALVKELENVTGYLRIGGFVIGIITLLGASIALMNIMMVSVTERTREIGIRKSLGATPRVIRFQFLSEAVIICLLGGLGGLLLGLLIGNVLSGVISQGKAGFVFPWLWMILGILVCIIVGVLSGVYPAVKASKLDPIEALRYE